MKYSELFSYKFGMSESFSINNIKYMEKFYNSFPIYYEELGELSFEHYKLLVTICDSKVRYFYYRVARFCRSEIDELNSLISNNVYKYI